MKYVVVYVYALHVGRVCFVVNREMILTLKWSSTT